MPHCPLATPAPLSTPAQAIRDSVHLAASSAEHPLGFVPEINRRHMGLVPPRPVKVRQKLVFRFAFQFLRVMFHRAGTHDTDRFFSRTPALSEASPPPYSVLCSSVRLCWLAGGGGAGGRASAVLCICACVWLESLGWLALLALICRPSQLVRTSPSPGASALRWAERHSGPPPLIPPACCLH